MKQSPPRSSHATTVRGLVLVLGLAIVASTPARLVADDRDLFRSEAAAPYVMVLFDATGSMEDNLSSRDTLREDDDPDSKLYLAKQALYDVLDGVENVNFGFATFPDQDRHYVDFKNFTFQGRYVTDRGGSGRSQNCSGWEPNNDRNQDRVSGYTHKWPNVTNARGLEVGDIVPLDWGDDNIQRIRERLAPNLALGESVPDFGIARYFRDRDNPGDVRRLRNEAARPFIAEGLTPLAATLESFRDWHDDWRDLAAANDPQFDLGCRQVFALLMTDGFETCNGNGRAAAARLLADGVKTYVVGFAVANPQLDQIAAAGGTESAYVAADRDELVAAFNQILQDVQIQSRTFASAAVPSVVGSAADSLYLTSFGPVAEAESLWPARVDAWVKPVRTTTVGGQQVPDRDRRCTAPDDRGCLAWDAGEQLLLQAPSQAQVDASNFRIGSSETERRVFWGRTPEDGEVPLERLFFTPPPDLGTQIDLYGPGGMGLTEPDPMEPVEVAEFAGAGNDVIKETLKKKTATIANPLDPSSLIVKDFVLGDIFHSDPMVLREPRRSDFFAHDLKGQLEVCGADNDDPSRYPCFVKKHLFRRRVFFAGSNDGQLHAFDAGLPRRETASGLVKYGRGTGGELFAYLPRAVLPNVRRMAEGEGQQFAVDGPVTLDDALIDPVNSLLDPPEADEREWRTVLVGGLREGGRAYYALDVTQPDPVANDEIDGDGNVTAVGLPIHEDSFVPGCIDGDTGCGPVPYATPLWELTDRWDEDGNGAPDLAYTWSRANSGRIRVRVGTGEEDRYVAVFGGGMDPDFEQQPLDENDEFNAHSGNYLYMVDVETGRILYKRRIDTVFDLAPCASLDDRGCVEPGYAPSEPAAVDTDFDSYLDTIYIGTSAGFVFKVDLRDAMPLETVTIDDYSTADPGSGVPPLEREVERVVASDWDPFPIFSTGGRPIYYPPSVIFVPQLSQFALAFGTGDRFDISRQTVEEGRFYVFVDTGFSATDGDLPFGQNALVTVDRLPAGTPDTSVNFFLQDPGESNLRGWVMELEPNERLLNRPFALAGLLTFNTFIPEALAGGDSCATTGTSRLYGVFATNGAPLHGDDAVLAEVGDFVTQPFVSSGDSADDMGSDDYDPSGEGGGGGAAGCDDELAQSVRAAIMQFFPEDCAFSNFSLDVEVMLSQTGLQCVVPIPVCVLERNWKEF